MAVAVMVVAARRTARTVVHRAAPAHLALAVAERLARRLLVPRSLDSERLGRPGRVQRPPVKEPSPLHRALAV